MKNRFNIFIISILMVLFSGCEDEFLDLESRSGLPASLALNNISGMEATMLQVYIELGNIHMSSATSYYKQAGTDIVKAGTNLLDEADGGVESMNNYSAALSASSPQIESIWNVYYQALNKCLLVIEAADVVETRDAEEEAKVRRFKGEAHAMLGYLYLELVRRFENIPFSTLQEEGTEPSLEAPLANKSAVYDTIIVNLTKAVELLPLRINTPGVGAPSKGLANLLLAEANLDLENWTEAATAAEAVIADPSYALQELDYIFGLEGGKAGEENNIEIIFSITWDPNNQERTHMIPQMFVPLYDRINGIKTSFESGGRPWSRFSPSDYYWDIWEEGDGRLEAWHKLVWTYDDEPNLPVGRQLGDVITLQDVIDQFGEGSIQTRYIEPTSTKFWEDDTYGREIGDAGGYRNVIVTRLAHAYLLAAEAYMRGNDEPQALSHLNTLRKRAFGDEDHKLTSLSTEIFLNEHARELGHEGHRWNMLKRMGLLVDRVQQHNPDAKPNIKPKHIRWPIPQSFIDLARVEQNADY